MPTGGLGAWSRARCRGACPTAWPSFWAAAATWCCKSTTTPAAKPKPISRTVGIYFAEEPTDKIVTGIAVTQPLLVLPAGKAQLRRQNVRADRCRSTSTCWAFRRTCTTWAASSNSRRDCPSGNKLPLISINDWDFNWQGTYRFAKPVRLPKGSVICLHAVYDNSADNPKNPNDPPREVRWGEQSTDEMCLCGVQVFTDRPADLQQIAEMPGYELAVGLEGASRGWPKKSGASKSGVPRGESRRGGPAFPPRGIPIFADKVEQLLRYDLDRNGLLTRDEISKMSARTQTYVLRRYFNSQ